MKILKWLDDNIEKYLSFLFYIYLTLIIFIEVIRRYVFNSSSTWGGETAVYAFIWMTYIAMAKGVKTRSHLSVDIVFRKLNRVGQFFILVLSDFCFLVLAVTVFYFSIGPIGSSIEFNQTMMGLNIPLAIALVAVPIGWGLVIYRIIQRFVNTVKDFRSGAKLTHETNIST